MSMDKDEKIHRENIAKRLKLSNKKLWGELKPEQRTAIVDKYYHIFDIENMTLKEIAHDNYDVRKNMALLILGALFGVFGGLFIESISRYLPDSGFFDVFIITGFFTFMAFFSHFIDKLGAENFRQNKVLAHLKKQLEEETKEHPSDLS